MGQVIRATVLALALAISSWAQAIPFISAGSATKSVGDIFTIPISITGAGDLTSFQFDLAFNALVLQVTATGVTESNFFTQADITVFDPGFVDNSAGHILGVSDALIFQSPVNGTGVLANIEFTALAAGVSALTLSNVFLNLTDAGFSVGNGRVCVDTTPAACAASGGGGAGIPEPGSLALLILALAALQLQRRITRRARFPQ